MDIAALGLKIDSGDLNRGVRALDDLTDASRRAEDATTRVGREAEKSGRAAKAANDNVSLSARAMGAAYRFALGAVTAFATAIGAAMSIRQFISATAEAEKVQAQLGATLRSTGGAAGQTISVLNEHAAALQRITAFGDEAVNGAQGLLLTFTRIRGDVFPKATEAVLDVATAMNIDLRSAALQVGKALNDPIQGVNALARSGIQFSAAQREVIKRLAETGDMAGAQRLILKELETQFGGSARAARDTLGGALSALSNAFGDLFEIGQGGSQILTRAIEGLATAISNPAFVGFVQTIGAMLFAALSLAVQGVTALIGVLPTLIEYLTVAGSALALLYAPTIVAGIGTVAVAIGTHLVGAVRLLTAAMMANPMGALAVGIVAAVTAIYHFRDEVKQAIGVDIVGIVKQAANLVIGSFVAAYEDIKFVWSSFPNIIGAAVVGAVNLVIEGVNRMVQAGIDGVNAMIRGLNSAIAAVGGDKALELFGFSGKIDPIGPFSGIGKMNNPYAAALSSAVGDRNAAINAAMTRNWLGDIGDAFSTSAPAAMDFKTAVDAANDSLGDLAGGGGAGGGKGGKAGTGGAATRASDALRDLAAEMKKTADEAIRFGKDVVGGFLTDMRQGLRQGQGFWETFGNAVMNVLDKILDKIQGDFVDALFGGMQGGGSGLFGWLFGASGGLSSSTTTALVSAGAGLWATGGYTGNLPPTQPAGIVHGGEYVFSAAAVNRIGVGALEAMHRSAKGYQAGGYVSGYPPVQHANGNAPAVTVHHETRVINNAPVQVRTEETEDGRGGRRTDVIIDEMVAGAMTRPRTRRAMQGTFGSQTNLARR